MVKCVLIEFIHVQIISPLKPALELELASYP